MHFHQTVSWKQQWSWWCVCEPDDAPDATNSKVHRLDFSLHFTAGWDVLEGGAPQCHKDTALMTSHRRVWRVYLCRLLNRFKYSRPSVSQSKVDAYLSFLNNDKRSVSSGSTPGGILMLTATLTQDHFLNCIQLWSMGKRRGGLSVNSPSSVYWHFLSGVCRDETWGWFALRPEKEKSTSPDQWMESETFSRTAEFTHLLFTIPLIVLLSECFTIFSFVSFLMKS